MAACCVALVAVGACTAAACSLVASCRTVACSTVAVCRVAACTVAGPTIVMKVVSSMARACHLQQLCLAFARPQARRSPLHIHRRQPRRPHLTQPLGPTVGRDLQPGSRTAAETVGPFLSCNLIGSRRKLRLSNAVNRKRSCDGPRALAGVGVF